MLNAAFDTMEPHLCDPTMKRVEGGYGGGMRGHSNNSVRGMLGWPKPWGSSFRELIAHPRLVPYLNTL